MTGLSAFLWMTVIITAGAIPTGLVLVAFLDAARTPGWVWAFSARAQVVWIALLLGGVVLIPLGIPLAAWYWWNIRPTLREIEGGRI